MALYEGKASAYESLVEVAKHCVQAVYKAPQVTARLELKTAIITGSDLDPVMDVMKTLGEGEFIMAMDHLTYLEAKEMGQQPIVVAIGANLTTSELGWDCGACGFATCGEFNKYSKANKGYGMLGLGPSCNWKMLDFGISCDWACAAAWQYNIENRIEFTVGAVINLLEYLDDCSCVLALPLGPLADLWYYNRPIFTKFFDYQEWVAQIRSVAPVMFQGFSGGRHPVIKTDGPWWQKDLEFVKVESDPQLAGQRAELQAKLMQIVMEKRGVVKEIKQKAGLERSPEA
jgi:uncharacterized ferredoxin-like protein